MADCGTHAGYCAGCRCWPCRKAHYDYNQTRDKQIAYGRWQKFVPAEPVREHVRSLMAAGIGWRRVAQAAGVQETSLNRIMYVKPLQKRVSTDIAGKLMAVRPSLDAIGCTTAIDGTGTRRRLQALIAVGWSQTKLAAHLGVVQTSIGRVLVTDRVTAGTARAVRDMYDKLWDIAVPEQDWRDKIAANRSRSYAAQRAWAPPMAWDDETIDDPDAAPVGVGTSKKIGKLPSAEDIAWLVQGGDSIEVIADRYGAKPNAVHQKLLRAKESAA